MKTAVYLAEHNILEIKILVPNDAILFVLPYIQLNSKLKFILLENIT